MENNTLTWKTNKQTNPPACFLGAIQVAATRAGKKEVGDRALVHADVSIGRTQDVPGLGLKVVLRIEGVEDQAILDAAHEVGYCCCHEH
jgi:organic hydroperoxide reductase OsmC/OhrA